MLKEKEITAKRIIDFILGKRLANTKVLEEFQLHNDEMKALVPREYAEGTHERYVTARSSSMIFDTLTKKPLEHYFSRGFFINA